MEEVNGHKNNATLDVAIIGAGIAGLAAAIALRRVGHTVTVYERSSFKNEVGAAIVMPPQASRILEAWGIQPTQSTSTVLDGTRGDNIEEAAGSGTILKRTRRVSFKTAETFSQESFDYIPDQFGTPFVSYHRADLHTLLRGKAEDLGATIRLGSPVESIDCQKGELTISRHNFPNEVHKHDLLVIADGINTSFVPQIVGRDIPLNRTGRYCFRSLIPISKILASPSASKIFTLPEGSIQGHDGISGTMNPQAGVFFVAYPCRDGKLMNIGIFDCPRADRAEKDDWNSPASIEDALEAIAEFGDSWKDLVKCADGMKAFTLAEREPLPTYVNGRAVLIGDAVHPNLPTLAAGGSTSLEDAAALGVLFSDIRSAEFDPISSRLALFNALRLPRDATQQILSTGMFKPQAAAAFKERIQPFYSGDLPGTVLGGWNKATCEFLCGYDVFQETEKGKKWAEEKAWKGIEKLPDGLVQHFGKVVP